MSRLLLVGKQSERLLFKKVTTNHFYKWLPFYEDPSSTEFWEGLPKDPYAACQQQFDRIFERYENNQGGMNALIRKEDNTLIGLCGLLVQEVDGTVELEIGYSILPNYRKLGYAHEAAERCKQHAKSEYLAKSVISIIHIHNLPSQKVAIKNGMYLDKSTTYKNNPVHIFRVIF